MLHILSSPKKGQGLLFTTKSPSSSNLRYVSIKTDCFMPSSLAIRTTSGVLKRGEIVLQQLAQSRQLIFEKASSCSSGNFFSSPRNRLVLARNCLFSPFFSSASRFQVLGLYFMAAI